MTNKTTPSAREILIECLEASLGKAKALEAMEYLIEEEEKALMNFGERIAQLSWEAGYKRGRQHNKTPITAPDKETFITNLMRENEKG